MYDSGRKCGCHSQKGPNFGDEERRVGLIEMFANFRCCVARRFIVTICSCT